MLLFNTKNLAVSKAVVIIVLALAVVAHIIPTTVALDLKRRRKTIGVVKLSTFKSSRAAPLPVSSGFFNQTVDHFGSQKGVNGTWFNQLYYVQDAYYKPGGPILFWIEGESPADPGWLDGYHISILKTLMPKYNAMAVSLEHRFYGAGTEGNPGRSVPTADLSPESLKLLTGHQAIEDLAKFVREFPSLYTKYKIPKDTKWIAIGGSYPGALAAWFRRFHPELIYAAHASSAPIDIDLSFWKYSYAVDKGMTFLSNLYYQNGNACMKGWTRAVKILDQTTRKLAKLKDPTQLKAFKSKFWMQSVSDNRDFTAPITNILSSTVQYGPNITSGSRLNGTTILDVVCGGAHFPAFVSPTASDDDLLAALAGVWTLYLQEQGYAGESDPEIAADYSTQKITDYSLNGSLVPLLWYHQTCNEFGWASEAQPLKKNALIESWSVFSQLEDIPYYVFFCEVVFDKHTTQNAIQDSQKKYGGQKFKTANILWVNGQYDPWRYVSIEESNIPPGGKQVSFVYENASHTQDLWGPLKVADFKWPRVTQAYEDSFFAKIFAVYDKWIYGPK